MIISKKRDNYHIISKKSIISEIVDIEIDNENGFRHELIDAIINIIPNTVVIRKLIILLKDNLFIKCEIILVLISYQ